MDAQKLAAMKRALDAETRRRLANSAHCNLAATNMAMEKITEEYFTEDTHGHRSEAGRKDGR